MKRFTVALFATLTLAVAACGGGDKPSSTPAPTRAGAAASATPDPTTTTATNTATTATKTATKTETTANASSTSKSAVGDIFDTVFSSALGSGPGSQSANGDADPALAGYLPPDSALPNGFKPAGKFTFRTPDGISDTGSMDIAAEMAISGDIKSKADLANLSMLMAMVIKPQDLQKLGDAFTQLKDSDKKDLEDAFREGASGFSGLKITDVKVLDADGLGQGGMGFQMTMDMSGLAGMFGAATDGGPQLGTITLRMYLFAEGDYIGAVMRMAFSDTLPDDVDEVALAHIIDGNLKKAP